MVWGMSDSPTGSNICLCCLWPLDTSGPNNFRLAVFSTAKRALSFSCSSPRDRNLLGSTKSIVNFDKYPFNKVEQSLWIISVNSKYCIAADRVLFWPQSRSWCSMSAGGSFELVSRKLLESQPLWCLRAVSGMITKTSNEWKPSEFIHTLHMSIFGHVFTPTREVTLEARHQPAQGHPVLFHNWLSCFDVESDKLHRNNSESHQNIMNGRKSSPKRQKMSFSYNSMANFS